MKRFSQINKHKIIKEQKEEIEHSIENIETDEVGQEGSEIVKFFSKLFESKEMVYIHHLQLKGDQGSFAKHETLVNYYKKISEMLDDTIETYQGQYGTIDGYEIIDTKDKKYKDIVEYLEETSEWLKHSKNCISDEDTHLHRLIDNIFCLIYRTIYKLKFLK